MGRLKASVVWRRPVYLGWLRLALVVCAAMTAAAAGAAEPTASSATSSGLADSLWPMFQADPQHTGRSAVVGPSKPDLVWEAPLDGTPGCPVIGPDGTIYLPTGMVGEDTAGYLYAIKADGTVRWRLELAGLPSGTSPAVAGDGTVYVHMNGAEGTGSAVERLVAISPQGVPEWTFELNDGVPTATSAVQSSPVIAVDGTIYVGSMDGSPYAIHADGSLKWSQWFTVASISSSPILSRDESEVIFVDPFLMTAYSPQGDQTWSVQLGSQSESADASPCMGGDGSVYVGKGDQLLALDSGGGLQWAHQVSGTPEIVATPAAAADGTLYVVADDGLHAVTAGGGLGWVFAAEEPGAASPVVASDGRIFWRGPSTVYAVNPDGSEHWSLSVAIASSDGVCPSAVLGSGGSLYVTGADGVEPASRFVRGYAYTGPDFALSCDPTSLELNPGGSAVGICRVRARQGFSGAVDLSCWNLPPGVGCTFDPSSVSVLSGAAVATLTITGDAAVEAGTNLFYVVGSSDDLSHYLEMELVATGVPELRFGDDGYWVGESDGAAVVTVSRSESSTGAVSVEYSTSDGTAAAGVDYVATAGSLTWADGETGDKTFTVQVLGDAQSEGVESVLLILSNPSGGAVVGDPSEATLMINDDGGSLQFTDVGYVVGEDSGVASVTVSRTGSNDGPVSVGYATGDLSARAGYDYEGVTGTLTWADGETGAKSFTVPVVDEFFAERSELVRLTLSSPTGGAALGMPESAVVLIADDDGPEGCTEADASLCLLEGQFRIETEWRDHRTGASGLATAVAQSNKTGFFWFFNADNIELIVKMLDGRILNDAYWLFYGGLSDVEYWITATLMETGEIRLYHNEPGDICGLGDTMAFPENKRERSATDGSTPQRWEASAADAPMRVAPELALAAACEEDDQTLCLLGGRFRVQVGWEDHRTGNTGIGWALRGTDNSGYFWFFNPENLELVVKVLNGMPVNGKYWVFYGALSDVVYDITVTDTQTGAVQQYVNQAGDVCGLGDIDAFAGD